MTQNESELLQQEKSLYNVRIRNLIGVFGMLLIVNIITFSPFIIATVVGLIIGLDNISPAAYTTVLLLFLLNNFTNSIIQAYFRQDLRQFLTKTSSKLFKRLLMVCSSYCIKSDKTDGKDHSNFQQSTPEIGEPDISGKTAAIPQKSQLHSSVNRTSQANNSQSASAEESKACPFTCSMDTLASDMSSH